MQIFCWEQIDAQNEHIVSIWLEVSYRIQPVEKAVSQMLPDLAKTPLKRFQRLWEMHII
jgi:hypothetical protein